MFHVTLNPRDPSEVLLSCDMTGSYISHDGGHHWRMFSLRGSAHFFAFDPVRPHVLYAATVGLWRSTDDGATWNLLWPRPSTIRGVQMDSDHADETLLTSSNPIGEIVALAIDPADSNTLYAAATKEGRTSLVLSRDGGTTWHTLHPLAAPPLRLWIAPNSPRSIRDLYAATPGGLEARIRGAWQNLPAPAGTTFTDISAGFPSSPQASPTFYSVSQNGLFVSLDGGRNWTSSALPGVGAKLRTVAASLHHPATAYASFREMKLDGDLVQGVARTDDSGQHWTLLWGSTRSKEAANIHDAWIAAQMSPQWTEEPLNLTVSDDDPDLAYATDLGRTLATIDGGKTWTARYSEPAGLSHSGSAAYPETWISTGLDVTTTYGYLFDPFDPNRRFILTTDIGLFRSEDAGRSWVRSVEGVPNRWRNTSYALAFDPEVRGKMWAAMSDNHDLPRPKMWRHKATDTYIGGICESTDGGRTWHASSDGMPLTAPTHLLLDPTSPAGHRTLWAATMGHGIYRSNNDGQSWEPINDGITQQDPLAWRLARASDGTLYALIARRGEDGSIGNSGDGALYRSTDKGDHWAPIALPAGSNAPNGIAIDPADPSRIYLSLWARETPNATLRPGQHILNGLGGGIALSTDGGKTWRWTLDRDRHIYDVTVDSRDPKTLYATGFESSAWISRDRGEHWARIPGYNFKWGHRVQPDPLDPDKVYISTFGGGVWHLSVSGLPTGDIATKQLIP